ncbi:TIGR03915 family putative DNA repair protein [uncultured Acetatifactor sp.]|uniref:TIGR03915 family putative DNA repair protein n=2 Tax=uncultured Acetatifactor sp. TaxID=1671927 RepID=UPI002609D7B3|nr:TIGR03915 family putative DNA repair protein [uncultured Acetatifactor sp.]
MQATDPENTQPIAEDAAYAPEETGNGYREKRGRKEMPMIVYRCEDTLESVFTAIYQAYEEKRNHDDTILSLTDDPLLFAEDIPVTADEEKTRKVMRTLERRFGREDCERLAMALASEDEGKAQAIYRTVVQGLRGRCRPGHLFDNLADVWVHRAFALARGVSTEVGHQLQFLRFQELENGMLFSRIGPKNDVVVFVMPHFADRLPIENFVIYDEKRNLFGIHPAGKPWYLLRGEEADRPQNLRYSDREREYQELFRQFCHTITVEGRENRKLQRGMLPLRFREYMVEFQ